MVTPSTGWKRSATKKNTYLLGKHERRTEFVDFLGS